MDYTTKIIEKLGQAVAELAKETMKEKQSEGIAGVETELRDLVRQIGGVALGKYLSSQSEKAEESMPAQGEPGLKYQGERKAVVISVFGRVEYRRGYYSGGGKGKAPLDEQFGLKPGGVSAGLAELLALGGIEWAFEQSQRFFREVSAVFGIGKYDPERYRRAWRAATEPGSGVDPRKSGRRVVTEAFGASVSCAEAPIRIVGCGQSAD